MTSSRASSEAFRSHDRVEPSAVHPMSTEEMAYAVGMSTERLERQMAEAGVGSQMATVLVREATSGEKPTEFFADSPFADSLTDHFES